MGALIEVVAIIICTASQNTLAVMTADHCMRIVDNSRYRESRDGGSAKWGLQVLVHNLPRLLFSCRHFTTKNSLYKRPRKCTVADDTVQIAESVLKPPPESRYLDLPENNIIVTLFGGWDSKVPMGRNETEGKGMEYSLMKNPLGSPQTHLFRTWLFALFAQSALFCALLRPFAHLGALLCTCVCAHLRSFAPLSASDRV